jgi:hypothetical protein
MPRKEGSAAPLHERDARACIEFCIRVGRRAEARVQNRDKEIPENGLLGNPFGTKTNEFNCYHSSHFQRRKAML